MSFKPTVDEDDDEDDQVIPEEEDADDAAHEPNQTTNDSDEGIKGRRTKKNGRSNLQSIGTCGMQVSWIMMMITQDGTSVAMGYGVSAPSCLLDPPIIVAVTQSLRMYGCRPNNEQQNPRRLQDDQLLAYVGRITGCKTIYSLSRRLSLLSDRVGGVTRTRSLKKALEILC